MKDVGGLLGGVESTASRGEVRKGGGGGMELSDLGGLMAGSREEDASAAALRRMRERNLPDFSMSGGAGRGQYGSGRTGGGESGDGLKWGDPGGLLG